MEQLLHYVWQHRLFPLQLLTTHEGVPLEIIDTGLYNRDAGPDFFNAKVRIDGQLWVGNIEIHLRSSDWYRHHHDSDPHYNNVVLHVAATIDKDVVTQCGTRLPQLQLAIPEELRRSYTQLMTEAHYPPCHRIIPSIPALHAHAWLDTLATERLAMKTARIQAWLERTAGDWERVFFITLARAFGFGKNTEAFEAWAATIDPQHIGKHRDDAFQVEAFFFGQAGLLDDEATPSHQRDAHFLALQSEYRYLQKKFHLTPIPYHRWQFLRLRPANFPHRRLAQLAQLYVSRALDFSKMKQAATLSDLHKLLSTCALTYWEEHFTFGDKASKKLNFEDNRAASEKLEIIENCNTEIAKQSNKPIRRSKAGGQLSKAAIDLLVINAIAPMLFAYAQQHQQEELQEQAFALLQAIRPEQNAIIAAWKAAGVTAEHAADTQALLHLKLNYCDRRECLRCRFGNYYLKSSQ